MHHLVEKYSSIFFLTAPNARAISTHFLNYNTKREPMISLDNLEVGPQLCRITVEKAKTARVFYSLNGGGQLMLLDSRLVL